MRGGRSTGREGALRAAREAKLTGRAQGLGFFWGGFCLLLLRRHNNCILKAQTKAVLFWGGYDLCEVTAVYTNGSF